MSYYAKNRVTMHAYIFTQTRMQAKTRKGNPRWNSQCAHGELNFAHWQQEQFPMRKTAYYDNNLSINAHTDIYSTNNARKILEGKPVLAIPMRALQCTRITIQKQVRPHGISAPMVRKHLIPLHALTLYLDPSLRTYVCPFLMRRMRF